MKIRLSLLTLCLFACTTTYSADYPIKVCGEADYVVPEYQSQAEARRTAIARARTKALADKFGTIVQQTNTTTMHNAGGQTRSDFNSYTENQVRGIWLEDIGEPTINMSYVNNMLVIHAEVCGKAREIKSNPVELQIQTLNFGAPNGDENPTRKPHETTEFTDGDFFGVRFKAPIDGYVAMFILDENNDIVYTQLPYEGSDGFARKVQSNKEYIFLTNADPDYPHRTTTTLTTERKIETNMLVVVFSKKQFHISLSNQGKWFPEIELSKFRKWIHGLRMFDESVQVEEVVLTIKK